VFYSIIETRDVSLFNQSAQALLKGYFIKLYINTENVLYSVKYTFFWKKTQQFKIHVHCTLINIARLFRIVKSNTNSKKMFR
jgi:hypothetical protein